MAENESEGPIRRAKKSTSEPAAPPAAASASSSTSAPSAGDGAPASPAVHAHDGAPCPSCTRLRAALRAARQRLRRLATENKTLREELLSAGEMIENLAQDLEKPY